MAFISQIEPKDIHEALKHESWINAMQEELEQIEWNLVWTLISRPVDHMQYHEKSSYIRWM